VEDTGVSSAPYILVEEESPAPPEGTTRLTRGQGVAIIVLLTAILFVGVVLIFVLLRRNAAREYLENVREYLGSRAHEAVKLGSKEIDELLSKKDALRLDVWEPKAAELIRAPRALVRRF
jgi:hypothetical protein